MVKVNGTIFLDKDIKMINIIWWNLRYNSGIYFMMILCWIFPHLCYPELSRKERIELLKSQLW
jgi:hypothetical protein